MIVRPITLLSLISLLLPTIAASEQVVVNWPNRTTAQTPAKISYEVNGVASSRFLADHPTQSFVLRTTCLRQGSRVDLQTLRWDNGEPQPGIRRIIDGWYLGYESAPYGKTALEAEYAADGQSRIGNVFPASLGVFDGYLGDDGAMSLRQIIQSSQTIRQSTEAVDGIMCLKIEAANAQYGNYTLWLDPKADYLPRRMFVQKQAQHLWSGQPLSKWDGIKARGSAGKITCTQVTIELNNVVLDLASGRWDVVSWRNIRTLAVSDGNADHVVMSGRRLGVEQLHALPSNSFAPELQDGAILRNSSNPQLPFVWHENKPQPWVDRSVIKLMDDVATQMRKAMPQHRSE